MRRLTIFLAALLLAVPAWGADTKVSAMTNLAALATGDELYCVDDPGGTPLTRACTIDVVATYVQNTLDASSELLAIMDDETGSGLLVFGTNPTFTTGLSLVPTGAVELDFTGGTTNVVNMASDAGFLFDLDDNNDGANNILVRDGADASVFSVNESGFANVLAGIDAIGAVDMDYGSADVTDHTFTTDGTGTAEFVIPAGSIDSTEILDGTIATGDLAYTPLQNVVEDTTPQLGGHLDVNGQDLGDGTLEILSFVETVSAVNEVTLTNAATGNPPEISATGDDANIDLKLSGKGTGGVQIGAPSDPADTGAIRLDNNTAIAWEASPAGTDCTMTLDTGEIIQLAGCTIDGADVTAASLTVAKIVNGTDGELITWAADATATTVAAGSSGQVLTSNGAGAAPTFQTASGVPTVYHYDIPQEIGSNNTNPASTADNCECWLIFLPVNIADLDYVVVNVGALDAGETAADLAIYSQDGNTQYFEDDITAAVVAGGVVTAANDTASPGTMSAGNYWFCLATDVSNAVRLEGTAPTATRSDYYVQDSAACASGEAPATISLTVASPTASVAMPWAKFLDDPDV